MCERERDISTTDSLRAERPPAALLHGADAAVLRDGVGAIFADPRQVLAQHRGRVLCRALARAKEAEASGLIDIVELRAELYECVMLRQAVLGWHFLFGPLVGGTSTKERAPQGRRRKKKVHARCWTANSRFLERKNKHERMNTTCTIKVASDVSRAPEACIQECVRSGVAICAPTSS